MSKINSCLSIRLKLHRMVIEGILLVLSITACNHSANSQTSITDQPLVADSSVTSNSASPPASATQNPTDEQQAVQVIHDYYNAIAAQDYQKAYSAWDGDGSASKQSFEQFKQGFANTVSVAEEIGKPDPIEGGAGSLYIKIPVTITTVTSSGTPQRFSGTYVLRRVNNVPGSTQQQRKWHIYSANISEVK